MDFLKAIKSAWRHKNTLLCIGLDPDLNKIPSHIKNIDSPFFEFNKAIIDSTHDLVCAYKPQIACYSARGSESDLERTIDYIHEHHPQVPVILDSKRGDIRSTAEMYAMEAFDRYHADAVTVNPYLGSDALTPFLNRREKGVIILCKTSNPGAGEIQDRESNGKKIYRIIAEKASSEWNYNGNVLLVVGATYPEELGEIRTISGDMPLLVPGIGTQGGDVREAVINGRDRNGTGIIINSSRAIIYASPGTDFAKAARNAALALRDEINLYRV
jgi:orotidine-5'-phosphate decarboxylase